MFSSRSCFSLRRHHRLRGRERRTPNGLQERCTRPDRRIPRSFRDSDSRGRPRLAPVVFVQVNRHLHLGHSRLRLPPTPRRRTRLLFPQQEKRRVHRRDGRAAERTRRREQQRERGRQRRGPTSGRGGVPFVDRPVLCPVAERQRRRPAARASDGQPGPHGSHHGLSDPASVFLVVRQELRDRWVLLPQIVFRMNSQLVESYLTARAWTIDIEMRSLSSELR